MAKHIVCLTFDFDAMEVFNGKRFEYLHDYRVPDPLPPPPTNLTCMVATPLTLPATLSYQASALGTENATGSCLATATGAVLYYRATVPARQTLAVRATPDSAMDAVVRILPACGATTCLASANAAGAGADESVQYANTGDTDQSVIIAVGSASNATNGRFDLEVFAFRSYTETTLATACDSMMGASPVMGVGGDDTHSALLDMPFTFPFFTHANYMLTPLSPLRPSHTT